MQIDVSNSSDQQYELLINQYKLLVNQFNQYKLLIDHYKLLIKHHHLMAGSDGVVSDEAVELVSELIAEETNELELKGFAGSSAAVAGLTRSGFAGARVRKTSPTAPTGPVRGAVLEKLAPKEKAAALEKTATAEKTASQEKAPAPLAPSPKTRPKQDDDDAGPRLPIKYWLTLTVLGLVAAVYWGTQIFLGEAAPTPERLVSAALTSPTSDGRVKAAIELTVFKEPRIIVPAFRRLAAESQDPNVLAVATENLSLYNDGQSLSWYLTAMEHKEKIVREAGFRALLKYYAGTLPDNIDYRLEGTSDEQSAAVRRVKDFVNRQKAEQEKHRQS